MKKFWNRKGTKITVRIFTSIGVIVLLIGSFTPWLSIVAAKMLWGTAEYNAGEEVIPTREVLDTDTVLYSDLTYGSTYENSFLDIYVPNQEKGKAKPTIFWVHGGGFTADDKSLTSETAEKLASEGNVVVNINYALVPSVHYPDLIYQLEEAYAYISKKAKQYEIDMNNIAFGGDSAGGQLIGQFVNIQVNKDYSKEIGIPATVKKDTIKAVLFYSALFNPNNIDSGNIASDYIFKQLVWGYFGNRNWEESKEAEEASILGNVNSDFPPTFITDGNTMSFPNQAKDLANELTQLGVVNELNLYSKKETELGHEYQLDFTLSQSVENYQKATTFLSKYLIKTE